MEPVLSESAPTPTTPTPTPTLLGPSAAYRVEDTITGKVIYILGTMGAIPCSAVEGIYDLNELVREIQPSEVWTEMLFSGPPGPIYRNSYSYDLLYPILESGRFDLSTTAIVKKTLLDPFVTTPDQSIILESIPKDDAGILFDAVIAALQKDPKSLEPLLKVKLATLMDILIVRDIGLMIFQRASPAGITLEVPLEGGSEWEQKDVICYVRYQILQELLKMLVDLFPERFIFKELINLQKESCIQISRDKFLTNAKLIKKKTTKPTVSAVSAGDDMFIFGPYLYSKWSFNEGKKIIHIFGESHRAETPEGYTCSAKNKMSITEYLNKEISLYGSHDVYVDVFLEIPLGMPQEVIDRFPGLIAESKKAASIPYSSIRVTQIDKRFDPSPSTSLSDLEIYFQRFRYYKNQDKGGPRTGPAYEAKCRDLLDRAREFQKNSIDERLIVALLLFISYIDGILRNDYTYLASEFVSRLRMANLGVICPKCNMPSMVSIFEPSFGLREKYCFQHLNNLGYPQPVLDLFEDFGKTVFPKDIGETLKTMNGLLTISEDGIVDEETKKLLVTIPESSRFQILNYFKIKIRQLIAGESPNFILSSCLNPDTGLFPSSLETQIMDLYVIAKLFSNPEDGIDYQNVIIYTGSYHSENYENFFTSIGMEPEKRIVSSDESKEFCLPLKEIGDTLFPETFSETSESATKSADIASVLMDIS